MCGGCPGALGAREVLSSWWHLHSLYLLIFQQPFHSTLLGLSELRQSKLPIASALHIYFLYIMMFWPLKTFLAGERLSRVGLANP